MAEQFLTLMADLDEEAQAWMSGWYQSMREAGFTGVQTPGLPYHISLSTFSLDQEKEAVEIARKAAAEFAPVMVHLSHIGMFAGGKVLFAAPEKDAALLAEVDGQVVDTAGVNSINTAEKTSPAASRF